MSSIVFTNDDNYSLSDIVRTGEYIAKPYKTEKGKNIICLGGSSETFINDMIALKKIYHKCYGRQYTQATIAMTPSGNDLTTEQYMEIGNKIAAFYYQKGFQVAIALHTDTNTWHFHLLINSVSYRTGHKFSQDLRMLNDFKTHCNQIFTDYGLQIVRTRTDKLENKHKYSIADGFEFMEIYDEIARDNAIYFESLNTEADNEDKWVSPDYPVPDGFNQFFYANDVNYRQGWDMLQSLRCQQSYGWDNNAWGTESHVSSPIASADTTPILMVKEQSPVCGENDCLIDNGDSSALNIDCSRRYEFFVSDGISETELGNITSHFKPRSEFEKNQEVRRASTAKAALNRYNDNSTVNLDLSETFTFRFDDGTTVEVPWLNNSQVIDVNDNNDD